MKHLTIVVALLLPAAAAAQPAATPEEALERIVTAPSVEEGWFHPDFLAAVSTAQIDRIVDRMSAELGPFQSVVAEGDNFRITFERGWIPTVVALDEDGQVTTLFFQPPVAFAASVEEALAPFREVPGDVGVVVREDGREVAALNPDAPLAVGSAFKMQVLEVLDIEVAAGRHSWDEVVTLAEDWRAPGSGLLEKWPEAAPLTLSTLANLMISLSDNTAADALIAVLGREAIEAAGSERNRPLLTTREMLWLKFADLEALADRYASGDEAERRAVLEELAALPEPPAMTGSGGRRHAIDWHYSARELCDMIERVAALDAMHINPGPAAGLGFPRIAFKGGSEPGVLSLTTMTVDEDGRTRCVAATWNTDGATDEPTFSARYRSLLVAPAGP